MNTTKSIAILLVATLALLGSCKPKENHRGKYVFVDRFNVLHLDRNCDQIPPNVAGERIMDIITLEEYIGDRSSVGRVCRSCVSIEDYEWLDSIISYENNIRTQEDNIKKFYRDAQKYFDLPDFNTFKEDMRDDTKRRCLYDNASKYFDLPDFEQFSSDLGYSKPKANGANNKQVPLAPRDVREKDRQWLYSHMVDADVNTGSYEDFEKSMANEEDLAWYYNKSKELGLKFHSREDFDNLVAMKKQQGYIR